MVSLMYAKWKVGRPLLHGASLVTCGPSSAVMCWEYGRPDSGNDSVFV